MRGNVSVAMPSRVGATGRRETRERSIARRVGSRGIAIGRSAIRSIREVAQTEATIRCARDDARMNAVTDECMRLVFDHTHRASRLPRRSATSATRAPPRLARPRRRAYLCALSFLDSSHPESIWVNSQCGWFGWCWRDARQTRRGNAR